MMLINAVILPVEREKSEIVALLRAKDNKESLDNILFAIPFLLYRKVYFPIQ